ncbi:MAG: 2-hydroxyacyl-CoA dehydratase [Planctomycetota bacterium]|jgi:benzoyl-CoA reductase/2-hydroxyglutaryl-CoA dehydratase subunit BcrC/BadD/HgdB
MKTVVYSCPYVPAEWIAAHGLRPSRVAPKRAAVAGPVGPIEGVCPYVRAFVNEVVASAEPSAVVVTTVCDQMRRAFDIIVRRTSSPGFLMNVPSTWRHAGARRLYLEELKRLGRFLVTIGGEIPSAELLADKMLKYESARMSLVQTRQYLTSRQFSDAIAQLYRNGKSEIKCRPDDEKPLAGGIPLAVLGGPLLAEDYELFDMIEESGGRIVLDATETGERGMPGPFDRRRLHDGPLVELADAYFHGIVDVSRRPNDRLYKWLRRELTARNVRGVILRRYLWCDLWHAELYRLSKWADVPVLDIDVSGEARELSGRVAQRVAAFLETLQ